MKKSGKLVKKIIAVAVMIVMVFQYGVPNVSAAETYNMEDFITSVEIEAEVNNVFYDVTEEECPPVPKDANVNIKLKYNPEYDKVNNKIKFNEGDKITYTLPEGIIINQNIFFNFS